jgi:hypothetical protein
MHVQGCQTLDLPSCSNMPPSTFVHSSRSLSAHIRPVTPLQISFKMVQPLKNFFNRTVPAPSLTSDARSLRKV